MDFLRAFVIIVVIAVAIRVAIWVARWTIPVDRENNLVKLYGVMDHYLTEGVTAERLAEAVENNDLRRRAADAVSLEDLPDPQRAHVYNNPLGLSKAQTAPSKNYQEIRSASFDYHPQDNDHHPFTMDLEVDDNKTVDRVRRYKRALMGRFDHEEDEQAAERVAPTKPLTPLTGGHCSEPQSVDLDTPCVQFCCNENARRIRGPMIYRGNVLAADEQHKYCWAGTPQQSLPATGKHKERHPFKCSQTTSLLVLDDDGKWQCIPQFPLYFDSQSGMTACKFNAYKHHPRFESTMEFHVKLVDTQDPAVEVRTGADFRNTALFKKLEQAGSKEEFMRLSNDPDYIFENRLACDCGGVTDVFDNPVQTAQENSHQRYYGLTQCNRNPCTVTRLAPEIYKYDAEKLTCTPVQSDFQNVKYGDVRTPIGGIGVSAMGARMNTTKLTIDYDNEKPFDINRAVETTRLMAPFIPARNNDATNRSRNVLYVPTFKTVLIGDDPSVHYKPSELHSLLAGCLPGIASTPPFSYAPMYFEPIPNVLADQKPHRPSEHKLLATEAMRTSRLVAPSVLGGSEMAFSTLLAREKQGQVPSDMDIDHSGDNPALERNNRIRRFYDDVFRNRRKSEYERYGVEVYGPNKHKNAATGQMVKSTYSRWDEEYRVLDLDPEFAAEQTLNTIFCLREGQIIRNDKAYAGLVLTHNLSDYSKMEVFEYSHKGNLAQMVCPTSAWIMPAPRQPGDFLSADPEYLYDYVQFQNQLSEPNLRTPVPLFPRSDPDYSASINADDHGINRLRYIKDFVSKNGNFLNMIEEPNQDRIQIDLLKSRYRYRMLPCGFFRPSNIEWGHRDSSLDKWFKSTVKYDLSDTFMSMLNSTRDLLKGMWWTTLWPREQMNYIHQYV